ncbi:hypothetical protein INT45_013631 [Circinella minor]|uniref:RRM domain-containing protein n=1 Tax=Circinella minor TaxID=1195481 RepID=A0A8H7RU75_9FUNG|nr:hypothetical protein INT45_013631 [Circinella minor]
MALPTKELETPVRETGTAPSTTFVSPTPVLTWARVVQAERVSLVHAHQQNNDKDPKAVIYYSHVWRVGRNSGSVIFDISPCPGFVNEAISKAMTIFPKNRGILIHREGKRVHLEVNLKTDEERTHALSQGILFSSSITIRAAIALDKNAKIQKVRLSNLPLLDQDELEKGLHETLGSYGEILDVGINRDPQTKAYMGNGFAVLDTQERTHKTYTKLDHHVPWYGDRDDLLIYANFDQMPLYCSRCHEAGHARDAKEQWTPGGSKRNRRKINSSSKDPSSSLLESKHAPASKPKQPPNQVILQPQGNPGSTSHLIPPHNTNEIPPPTGNSGAMVIDELTDSEEYRKLGYIEQKMDKAILSFIDIDHNQIDENIREQARIIILDHDWMAQLHISDTGQTLIHDTNLNLEWQAILLITLQHKLAHFIQEYEVQTPNQELQHVGVTTRSHSQQQEQQPPPTSDTSNSAGHQ